MKSLVELPCPVTRNETQRGGVFSGKKKNERIVGAKSITNFKPLVFDLDGLTETKDHSGVFRKRDKINVTDPG